MPRLIKSRLKDRLSSPISLSQLCKDPACRHPFSMHKLGFGCTFYKRDFGRNGFCQCDGFIASDLRIASVLKQ
jgi:hypothetical protein